MTNSSADCSCRQHRKVLPAFVFLVASLAFTGVARAACDAPVASIVSIQGTVEVSAAGQLSWHPAAVGQALCPGELVTVRKQSRATVLFEGDVLTRLDQYTTLQVAAPPRNGDAALGLSEGIAHVISRLKKRVEIIAPVVNALVEGTEFTVVARSGSARVVVAEGRVRVSNPAGETLLLAGQAADVAAGDAPAMIAVQPLDSVQWAIYYPLVVWPADEALKEARALGVQAKYPDALARIAADDSAAARAYRANLLLALGRFDDAGRALVDTAESKALEAVIAIAQGRVAEGRGLIDAVLTNQPDSAAVQLAASHVSQAEGRLDEALGAARQATVLMPENPIAWARRAELELTLARIEEGRRSAAHALELSPKTVRAKAMLGFALALAGQYGDAQVQLDAAIADNPADPLAHYALGLVRIRQGELVTGRRELEIAVLLDPSNVEYRSTLGRAYMAEAQDKHAATQLDLAARLDPASPTPLFFSAQRRLGAGDVIGAIEDGRHALALNDNRLTLRSPALLATDRAARATTLGSAYQAAGFDSTLKRIGSEAVEADPASGPAHRLMAQAYTDDLRLESARVSEQFQSFAYGDIGQPMVMPQSLVTALPVLDGARVMSLDETAAMFVDKPYRFSLTGLVGSQETWGTSVMATARSDRFQAAVGHFDYRSDGFAEGSDVDISTTRAEFRAAATPHAMVFADVQHKDFVTSDITQALFTKFNSVKSGERSDLARVGVRWRLSPSSSLVVLAANESGHQEEWTNESIDLGPSLADSDVAGKTRFSRRELAARLDASTGVSDFVLGMRWHRAKSTLQSDITNSGNLVFSFPPFPPIVIPFQSVEAQNNRRDVEFEKVFARWTSALSPDVSTHVGLDFTRFEQSYILHSSINPDTDASARDTQRLSPSLGLVAKDVWGATVRTAVMQGVSVSAPGDQTVEPTRFAGFDGQFDDVDGTRYRRYGLGFERRFGSRLTVGGEWSLRKIQAPYVLCESTDCTTEWFERRHGLYASAPLARNVAMELGWHYNALKTQDISAAALNTDLPVSVRTETIPLRLFFQWPSHWRLMTEVLRVRQDVANVANLDRPRAHASFWMTNLRLHYGAPGAFWEAGVDVRNVFDQKALIQDTDLLSSEAKTPLWYPERSLIFTARIGF